MDGILYLVFASIFNIWTHSSLSPHHSNKQMVKEIKILWKNTLSILQKTTKQILVIHTIFTGLAIIVFAPLTGLVVQLLLNLSGKPALSDLDIAYFFLTPLGMVTGILVASLTITALVFEQAALMATCFTISQKPPIASVTALLFTMRHVKTLFMFSTRLVFRILFIIVPFVGLAVAIAWVMMSEYDINYYLSVRPPNFTMAATAIGLILLVMTVVLTRNLTSWSLTLPLVLFTDETPAHCFSKSEQLMRKDTHLFTQTLGIWVVLGIVLSAGGVGVIQIISLLLPSFIFSSLGTLMPVLGSLALLWCLSNFLITAITAGSFAALLTLFFTRTEKNNSFETIINSNGASSLLSKILFSILLFATATTSIFTATWFLNNIPTDNDTAIIAHRGAAGKAPENTLVAMRHAINDGADWLEIDVQETLDGEVIVIHDSDFMKLANKNLKVWNGTFEEIRNIDVGSWFNTGFSAERVPLLAEILELAKGKCRVLIELKYYGHNEQLEQRVVDIVEEAGMEDYIAIMSLQYSGLQNFKALRPNWPLGLLSTQYIGKLSNFDVNFIAVNANTAKPTAIRRIQSAGKLAYVWTVNDRVSMARMMALGVDGIITDEPAMAAEVRTAIKLLNPMERLLLHTTVLLKMPIPSRLYRDKSP